VSTKAATHHNDDVKDKGDSCASIMELQYLHYLENQKALQHLMKEGYSVECSCNTIMV